MARESSQRERTGHRTRPEEGKDRTRNRAERGHRTGARLRWAEPDHGPGGWDWISAKGRGQLEEGNQNRKEERERTGVTQERMRSRGQTILSIGGTGPGPVGEK